jgi:hypothetical protein
MIHKSNYRDYNKLNRSGGRGRFLDDTGDREIALSLASGKILAITWGTIEIEPESAIVQIRDQGKFFRPT